MNKFVKALGDYPDLQPWQEEVLRKFQNDGLTITMAGRRTGKSWATAAMQRLMDDLANKPIEDLQCSTGTVFGARYYTVEPIGGNWLEMEVWCTRTFGEPSNVWETMKDGCTVGRWYMNDRKFWFREESDRDWFIIRWNS